MTVQTNREIDIAGELERVDRDLEDMEINGNEQIQLSFFGGNAEEKEILTAIIKHVKARGYACEVEYEDGEIWLTLKRV
jgi:hypothetical protein